MLRRADPVGTESGAAGAVLEQAGGIVVWGDRVVLRRNSERRFVFPKGHLEPGETHREAAVREVQEETGLIVEPIVEVGSYLTRKRGTRRRVTLYLMRVADTSAEWPEHLGVDAFPVPWEWVRAMLAFKRPRALWDAALPRVTRMVGAGAAAA